VTFFFKFPAYDCWHTAYHSQPGSSTLSFLGRLCLVFFFYLLSILSFYVPFLADSMEPRLYLIMESTYPLNYQHFHELSAVQLPSMIRYLVTISHENAPCPSSTIPRSFLFVSLFLFFSLFFFFFLFLSCTFYVFLHNHLFFPPYNK